MRVLLTGATGLIGTQTAMALVRAGHEIVAVSRNPSKSAIAIPLPAEQISWREIEAGNVPKVDAVIHLAGESIFGGLWTHNRRKRIIDSRVKTTTALVNAFAKQKYWPAVWVNGSAVGYYGDRKDELLDEQSTPGTGFLADVCRQWEAAVDPVPKECRVVKLRTSLVLAKRGGALGAMLPAFRMGVGGRLGSGNQWMSWIHSEDLVQLILYALSTPSISGPLNATSPEPVINRVFTSELSRIIKRPAILPVPSFLLRLTGELSTLFLSSQRVEPKKALANGFVFRFKNLEAALRDLIDHEQKPGVHELYRQQWIPHPISTVFPFFCDERNLEQLTPPSLSFQVLSKNTQHLQAGTLIDYRLKIHGIPIKWRTKILEWQRGHKFVDSQLTGPYKLWHHTHEFESIAGGTLMTDRVLYKLPLWPLGEVGLPLVKSDVSKIFQFRREVVQKMFGKTKTQ